MYIYTYTYSYLSTLFNILGKVWISSEAWDGSFSAAASLGSTCIAIKICLCQLYNETTCVPGHRMTRRIVSLGWFSEKQNQESTFTP